MLANTLGKIFAMSWTRLMGLKSVTLVASIFLGRRIMEAEFSHSKPWAFNVNKLFMAAITSSLMVSQQALKKVPVKPSGPGALSEGMEYIVFFYLVLGERHL